MAELKLKGMDLRSAKPHTVRRLIREGRRRPMARAVQITARFPKAHGAPVHVGAPLKP